MAPNPPQDSNPDPTTPTPTHHDLPPLLPWHPLHISPRPPPHDRPHTTPTSMASPCIYPHGLLTMTAPIGPLLPWHPHAYIPMASSPYPYFHVIRVDTTA